MSNRQYSQAYYSLLITYYLHQTPITYIKIMAKLQDLGQNLSPSRIPKKSIVEEDKAEKITTKIHAVEDTQVTTPPLLSDPEPSTEPVKKTSFDFPVSLYRSIKIRVAEQGVSMRDYVIGLIEEDLKRL